MNISKPRKLGPIELEAGVTRFNAATFLYAAFFSISLVSILNFLQAYIITQHLLIPEIEQGSVSGDLQVWNEIVAILLVVPLGMWSDRIGRRIIIVCGLVVLGLSYIWYPLVTSVAELIAVRIVHSIGAAGITGMLGIVAADYARETSRGKLVTVASMLIGLGIATITRSLGFAGYSLIGLVADPLSSNAYPAFALLGLGQISTLIGSQTLVAKVANHDIRGSVIGMFGLWGAIGIILSAFFGGRLFDLVSPSAPFVMVGLVQGFLLAVALVVRLKNK